MARSHKKQREWKRLSRIMKQVDEEMEKRITEADENLCVSGLYGKRQSDPTARDAIRNIERRAAG